MEFMPPHPPPTPPYEPLWFPLLLDPFIVRDLTDFLDLKCLSVDFCTFLPGPSLISTEDSIIIGETSPVLAPPEVVYLILTSFTTPSVHGGYDLPLWAQPRVFPLLLSETVFTASCLFLNTWLPPVFPLFPILIPLPPDSSPSRWSCSALSCVPS